jgi:hypothetical protein
MTTPSIPTPTTGYVCWCPSGAECDRIARHAYDKGYQDAMVAHVRAAANELLDAAGTLGWGSGEPAIDADMWLTKVAIERGLLAPLPPPPLPPTRRAEANRAAAKAFRRIGERDGFYCRTCGIGQDLQGDDVGSGATHRVTDP